MARVKKESSATAVTRRAFLKRSLFTTGLLASGGMLFGSSAGVGSVKNSAGNVGVVLYGRSVTDIYPVAPSYQRFDERRTSFTRSMYDKGSVAFGSLTRYRLVLKERVKRGEHGFTVKDYALKYGSDAIREYTESGFGNMNRGLYSWSPLRGERPKDLERFNGDPDEAAKVVKRAAKHLGADLVGICALDKRWVYSHDSKGRRIEFEDVEEWYETKEKIVIPNSHKYVVVIALEMKRKEVSYAPYVPQTAEAGLGYDKMAIVAARVAEFLRALGYHAIPCGNDTALSVPLAIDAGLGQYGRNTRLVTPEYGPNVRLCKVFTDLPMTVDHPIDFGLTEFCNACKKCVDACPVKSLPHGDPTWEGPTASNNPGVLKWNQNPDRCLRYWGEVGTDCAICFRVCPWGNGVTRNMDSAKWVVQNIRQLNPIWRPLDDTLGYGRLEDPEKFWEQ